MRIIHTNFHLRKLPHQLCKKFTKYSQNLLNLFSSFTNFSIAGEGILKKQIVYMLYSDAAENQYSDSWNNPIFYMMAA